MGWSTSPMRGGYSCLEKGVRVCGVTQPWGMWMAWRQLIGEVLPLFPEATTQDHPRKLSGIRFRTDKRKCFFTRHVAKLGNLASSPGGFEMGLEKFMEDKATSRDSYSLPPGSEAPYLWKLVAGNQQWGRAMVLMPFLEASAVGKLERPVI